MENYLKSRDEPTGMEFLKMADNTVEIVRNGYTLAISLFFVQYLTRYVVNFGWVGR